MRQTIDVEIDGHKYTLVQSPATVALKNMATLTKLIGEPLAMAAGGMNEDVGAFLPKAVKVLSEKLDEDKVVGLVKDLLKSAVYNGQPVTAIFDTHFQGRLGSMFKLLLEVLKHQYADFFDILSASLQGPAEK